MGKNDMLFTMLILILSALGTATVGWRWKVYRNGALSAIWLYCVLDFIALTLSTALAYNGIHTIWLLSIQFGLAIVLLAFYFCSTSELLSRHFTHFILGIIVVILMAWLHNSVSSFPEEEKYKEFFVAKSYFFAAITILVLIHFYDLIRSTRALRIDQIPSFWISAGLLLYATGSFIPELSNVYGFKMSSPQELQESRIVTFVISNTLALINYLMIFMAFRLYHKLQKV